MTADPRPSPAAAAADDRRRMLAADIERLLARAREGRLEMVRQFLLRPTARVFVPRSAQGPALFARLTDLDALFARAEQKLLRQPDPYPAFETKARLERDLCELHVLLIELCADLAVAFGLEASDPAIVAAMKRIRERGPAAASAGIPPPAAPASPQAARGSAGGRFPIADGA